MPIGAVTVTDAFNLGDKVTPAAIERCCEFVRRKYEEMIPWAEGLNLPVIGVGGTVRNLAKMDQAQTNYQLSRIHNYIIPRRRFEETYTSIIKSNLSSRKRMKGLSSERADLIVAGAIIINTLMEFTGGQNIIVSGCGLRDGVFFEYYGETYGYGDGYKGPIIPDVLQESVHNYLLSADRRMEHLERVRTLALSLFDQLKRSHGGTRQVEQIITGFIAGFHHGISNKIMRAYRYGMMLTPEDWKKVRRLSLLLALAEASDVTYEGVVRRIDVADDEEAVVLSLRGKKGEDHSAAGFEMKSYCKQFKKEYGKPLIIMWQKG